MPPKLFRFEDNDRNSGNTHSTATIKATASRTVNGIADRMCQMPLVTNVIKPVPIGNIGSVIGDVIELIHSLGPAIKNGRFVIKNIPAITDKTASMFFTPCVLKHKMRNKKEEKTRMFVWWLRPSPCKLRITIDFYPGLTMPQLKTKAKGTNLPTATDAIPKFKAHAATPMNSRRFFFGIIHTA